MANRFPLILDTADSNKIKELPSGDNLDLTGSGISAVGNITGTGTVTSKDIKMTGYTTSERDALTAAEGQLIYNTSTDKFQGYDGSAWQTFQGIERTDLSVTTAAASGGGALAYNNNTGVFTFTPAATTAQTLSLVGNNLSISAGNTLDLSNILGAESFVDLDDVPSDFVGSENAFVKVNTAGDALEFVANPGYLTAVNFADVQNKPTTISGYGITDAQTLLTSGQNIKTINGESILGAGNINIVSGSGSPDFSFGIGADDSTMRPISSGENIKIIGGTNITTSSDAEGNITITNGFTQDFAYASLTGAPTNISEFTNDAGYVTSADTFSFSVTADDSTLRSVDAGSSIQFIGGTNITTSSDADGNITITGATIPSDIQDLGNVTITSPQTGQVLKWNGSAWVNDTDAVGSGGSGGGGLGYIQVGADDSSVRTVNDGEAFLILGGSGITTTSDAEGNITIATTEVNDYQGNFFADDSTLLIDGSNGTFPGITGSDLDMAGNKVLFGNVYSNVSDLPDASSYHGMFAHVHSTGKGYFAHGGQWVELQNADDAFDGDYDSLTNTPTIPTDVNDLTDADGLLGGGSGAPAYYFHVGADDSTARRVDRSEQVNFLGGTGISTASDAEGNITITATGSANTGDVTFSGTTIDSNDSSGIEFTPAVTMNSDLTVENDIVCSNVVYAESFQSTGVGAPTFTSNSSITLSAVDRVNVTRGPLNQASFTTVERDALSPMTGDTIWNTTTNDLEVYNGSSWENSAGSDVSADSSPALGGTLDANGNDIDMGTNTITDAKVGNWDTAYGWGDHSSAGYSTFGGAFSDLSGKPTTLSGYGITDGLASVVADTTPQLGGDLDMNGKTLSHTFNVVNSGASDYSFTDPGNKFFPSATLDPVLYLRRGETYKFVVNASSHPFEIRVSNGGSAYSTGITNNGASVGTVTFVVPMEAPATLYYQCTAHSGMGNTINIV